MVRTPRRWPHPADSCGAVCCDSKLPWRDSGRASLSRRGGSWQCDIHPNPPPLLLLLPPTRPLLRFLSSHPGPCCARSPCCIRPRRELPMAASLQTFILVFAPQPRTMSAPTGPLRCHRTRTGLNGKSALNQTSRCMRPHSRSGARILELTHTDRPPPRLPQHSSALAAPTPAAHPSRPQGDTDAHRRVEPDRAVTSRRLRCRAASASWQCAT